MTYEALQLKEGEILDVLLEARRQEITTIIHAENGAVIDWMMKKLEEKKLFAPKYHVNSHPPAAEIEATYRAISLSSFIDMPILIVHVSSPAAAACISEAQKKRLPVYAETCPQYLFLTRKGLDKPGFEGAKFVCSPPPREREQDHEAIWAGLQNGAFTVLSSDYCPFIYYDDQTGKKSVISEEFPNGCPGVETRLALTLSAEVRGSYIGQCRKTLWLASPKGALLPGQSDTDLTIWYPENGMESFELKNEMLHHNFDYTPYEGRKLKQWPRYTILRGQVVWDRENGGIVGEKGYGKFFKRGISTLAGSKSQEEWSVENF
jgi:dihydropyrimidinase